ncbi:MAG: tol-pal system protein YbgF [Nitrospirota bacterium]|nr:tol-pal system protein YbgF [Nitrospirota bacterium]
MKFFSVLLLLLASACVAGPDFQYLRQDVNELKRNFYQTKRDLDALKDRSAFAVGEDTFKAVQEGQGEINSKLSEVSLGLQELRGRFEENKYYTEKQLKESVSERDMIEARLAGMEAQIKLLRDKIMPARGQVKTTEPVGNQPEPVAASGPEDESSPTEPTETVAAGTVVTGGEQVGKTEEVPDGGRRKAYEAAYKAFKEKKFKDARKRFEAFLKDYPGNDLTDNAQFWIAETYYAENNYEDAILAYETVLKKYPDSDKTGGAMLKQGFAFIELGDKKTGGIILDRLIEKLPDSKEAAIAKKKIELLEAKPIKDK